MERRRETWTEEEEEEEREERKGCREGENFLTKSEINGVVHIWTKEKNDTINNVLITFLVSMNKILTGST